MTRPAEPTSRIPLGTLLDQLAAEVTTQAIDQIWVFPTRRSGATDSHLMIVSAHTDQDPDHRRIFAVQRILRPDEKADHPHDILTEYGSAPADRVPQLIEGVATRLRPHQDAEPPRVHEINGDQTAWIDFRQSLDPPVAED